MASTTSKLPELKKQYLVVFILSKVVSDLFDDVLLVPQENAGKQVRYPFVTFKQINSHQDTTADHRPDQFNVRLQLDVHADDQFQSEDMAEDLRDALLSSAQYRSWFTQAYIVPFALTDGSSDINDHTTLPGINYDNMYGFDMFFQVSHADAVYQDSNLHFDKIGDSSITSVQVNGKANGLSIGVNQQKEDK